MWLRGWEKAPGHRGENCQAGNNGVTRIRKDEPDVTDREGLDIHFSFECLDKQKFLIAFGFFH